jgi:glutamine amidotransferase
VGESRSLFHSTDVSALRTQYPDNEILHGLSEDTRLVVSEPLGDLQGAWTEVPESTCLVVRGGKQEMHDFAPAGATTAAR